MFTDVDGKLDGPQGPLVVIDRCIMLKHIPAYLPECAEIVLPDVLVHEIAESPRANELEKFNGWARRHADRIWIGRFWHEMSREEVHPTRLVDRNRAINVELTFEFRATAKNGELDWESVAGTEDVPAKKSEFIALAKEFDRKAKERDIDWKKEFPDWESRVAFVRGLGHVGPTVRLWNERFCDPIWDEVLDVFPDQLAVARMARLLNWNFLKHSMGETRDFKNSYEDVEYALTASYVGRLATVDRNLLETMRAVFPDCELHSTRH